jgi:hypothetical protein
LFQSVKGNGKGNGNERGKEVNVKGRETSEIVIWRLLWVLVRETGTETATVSANGRGREKEVNVKGRENSETVIVTGNRGRENARGRGT